MRSVDMARDYAVRAEWCLDEAERAFAAANYPITVRRSQEALEMASKAVLRKLAVEYPHEHDVGDALDRVSTKLPEYVAGKLDQLKALLTELARVRGPALYGYEQEAVTASQAFNLDYATKILNQVKLLVKSCVRFARE